MPDSNVAHAFVHIVSAGGREERFTCKILSGRRLIAWTPGALVPMVIHGGEGACLLDPLVEHVEQHGMPVGVPAGS